MGTYNDMLEARIVSKGARAHEVQYPRLREFENLNAGLEIAFVMAEFKPISSSIEGQ